jgi:excisionase family DNA binding protein
LSTADDSCSLAKLIGRDLSFRRQANMTEPWVSVDEVAKHLDVARDSIYRWIERRGLPARRIGRLWKFKISEVDEWVRAGGANSSDPKKDDKR